MPDSRLKRWGMLGAFLVGLLLGPGSLWQYRSASVAERSAEVETVRASAELRGRLNEILIESLNVNQLREQLSKCDRATADYDVDQRIRGLLERTLALADDAKAIEGTLAQMEGRKARSLASMRVPPKPPNIVTIVESPSEVDISAYPEPHAPPGALPCPPL